MPAGFEEKGDSDLFYLSPAFPGLSIVQNDLTLFIIIIVIKNILSVIASLSYMVGCIRDDYSSLSWHGVILSKWFAYVKKKVAVCHLRIKSALFSGGFKNQNCSGYDYSFLS